MCPYIIVFIIILYVHFTCSNFFSLPFCSVDDVVVLFEGYAISVAARLSHDSFSSVNATARLYFDLRVCTWFSHWKVASDAHQMDSESVLNKMECDWPKLFHAQKIRQQQKQQT